jgi:hypothetical protein
MFCKIVMDVSNAENNNVNSSSSSSSSSKRSKFIWLVYDDDDDDDDTNIDANVFYISELTYYISAFTNNDDNSY